jgi:hypothetical protein
LQWIGQHYQTLEPDFERHKEIFTRHLENLVQAGPIFINSQTGKDYFSFEENEELIRIALGISLGSGVRIFHETHRGKFAFAAHITRQYCDRIPDLKLTLDISHWCNVAETFLQDQEEAVAMALSRTEHIHSRVGYTEGPQVGDPRAPEWKAALDHHLAWWDRVIDRLRTEGRQTASITTEFGPYPYMVHLPYSQKAIADQWDLNIFMRDLLTRRYS